MIPHIISDPSAPIKRGSGELRIDRLKKEMERQGIVEYRLWPAISYANLPRRTGISHSHKAIVKWAMEEGLPEVCIFEDDIRFPAIDGFQYYLSKKPKTEYDLYLGCVYRGEIDENFVTKRYTGQICCTISERYYELFLATDDRVDIDGGQAFRGLFYVCYPFACLQYNGFSINLQENVDHNYLLVGKPIRGLEIIDSRGMSEEIIITDLPPF